MLGLLALLSLIRLIRANLEILNNLLKSLLKGIKTKKGITFVIPFDALQDGLEPTTP